MKVLSSCNFFSRRNGRFREETCLAEASFERLLFVPWNQEISRAEEGNILLHCHFVSVRETVSVQPTENMRGFDELQQIFQGQHDNLQETNTRTSSNNCQWPKPVEGSCTLWNDHPQARRKADTLSSVRMEKIYKSNPLLKKLLEGNKHALTSAEKPDTSDGVQNYSHRSAKGHMSQKGTVGMVSSSCGQTKATHAAPRQPDVLHSSLSTDPPAYSSMAADVGNLPTSAAPMYHTNAEILELINERIALFRARQRKPDHSRPNVSSGPSHSAAFCSDKNEGTLHCPSPCLLQQCTAAAGQASQVDRLKGTQANAGLTARSDKNGNVKHSNCTTTSSVELSPHETVDKSIAVRGETVANNQRVTTSAKESSSVSVRKAPQYEAYLDAEGVAQPHRKHTESQFAASVGDLGNGGNLHIAPAHPASGSKMNSHGQMASQSNAKLTPKEGELKGTQANEPRTDKNKNGSSKVTTSSSVPLRAHETVDECTTGGVELPEQTSNGGKFVCSEGFDARTDNSKHGANIVNVNSVTHYSLNALKELAASLDNAVSNAEVDNFSEVLLQKYWNGDKDNVGVFASTEYPQIMLEVAATCTRCEESPVVLTALSPHSSIHCRSPQEVPTRLNVGKKLPANDQVCEGSSIPKCTAEKSRGDTSLQPVDIGNIPSGTNLSVCPQRPRKQVMKANEKNTEDMDSSKVPSKVVDLNSKQSSLVHHISSKNIQQEPLPSHSSSHSVGQTVANQGATSLDKETFSFLKVPQYEDISDAEVPVQPHMKYKESQFTVILEDISDDENLQTEDGVLKTQTPPAESSGPEGERHGQTDSVSPANLRAEPLRNCSCPYYIETEAGFEQALCPECDCDRQKQINGSQRPSNVLKKAEESDSEGDDCLVIPLKESDITMNGQAEPNDADHEKELIGTSIPVPASNINQSTSSLVQIGQPGNCSHIPPEGGMLGLEISVPHNSRDHNCESEDSCETEDSSDYMPTQGQNYLTVSSQAWKNRKAPKPSGTEDKGTGFHQNQKRRRQRISTKKLNLDSDTEDENDNRTKVIKTRKKPVASCSADIGATSFSHQKRLSSDNDCETVVDNWTAALVWIFPQELPVKDCPEDRIELLTDSETDDSVVVYKNAKRRRTISSDSDNDSTTNEKREPQEAAQRFQQHLQAKSQAGQSKQIQSVSSEPTHNKTTKQGLKPINAEPQAGPAARKTNRQICNRAAYKDKRKDKTNNAKRRVRIHLDSSETEEDEDGFSDVSDSQHVSGQLSEARASMDSVRPKTSALMTSKRPESDDELGKNLLKENTKTARLSETEDGDDNFSDTKLTSPQKPPDKHPQYADGTSSPSEGRIVNRLYIQKSQSNERLTLSKRRPAKTHRTKGQPQVAATVTEAGSSKRQQCWNRNKWGRFAPNPKSSSSSHPAVQLPTCKPSTSGPNQHVPASRQQLSHSYSHPPASDPAFTKNHSLRPSAQTSALEKVKGIWKDQFFPIPVHKKAGLGTEDSPKTDVNPVRESEPGPSRVNRRKQSATKLETPLMKKAKSVAKERTRDINYKSQRQTGHPVADHYKWKDPRDGRKTQGSRVRKTRCSSSPELEWD